MTVERKPKLMFIVNVDWFFISHRLAIATRAIADGYEVHIATTMTDGHDKLARYGLTVHPIQLDRGGSSLRKSIQTFYEIRKILANHSPDIVHLVTIKPVLIGGIAARIQRTPAIVAAISGLGYIFLADGWLATIRRIAVGALYRLALNHPNCHVIFQNSDDQKTVETLAGLKAGGSTLIPGSGIPLDVFTPSPLPPGPPIVMLAARLLSDKGIIEFVNAAQLLKKKWGQNSTHARFVLVGSIDPDNPTSFSQAKLDQWQSEHIVELWGYRHNMPTTLSQATIVVLPSYREGFPKVLMEAAASARAIITTDVPGCRDAIRPGITGLLVPAKNSAMLANAIEELLMDGERCKQLGAAGRKLAEEAFDVNAIVANHMAIYSNLLQRNRAI